MHNSAATDDNSENAMRALRFELSLALFASVALHSSAASASNEAANLATARANHAIRDADRGLDDMLTALIASAGVDPVGKLYFDRPLGDERFLEPNSGHYWQISGEGHEDFSSRSLWNRKLKPRGGEVWSEPLHYDSDQFESEPLRVVERTVRLPGSDIAWQFVVAQSFDEHD